MKPQNDLFDTTGHLSDAGLAAWIENQKSQNFNNLPNEVDEHVEECLHCKELILHVWETMELIGKEENEPLKYEQESTRRSGKILMFNSPGIVRIAAAILLLVSIGSLLTWFLWKTEPDSQELYAANFSKYPDLVSERGESITGSSWDSKKIIAFGYYDHNQLDSAIIVFSHLAKENPASDTVRFFLAVSLLANGDSAAKAIRLLDHPCFNGGTFHEQALWYRALGYLKNNQPDSSKLLLSALNTPSSGYRQKAISLLNELK